MTDHLHHHRLPQQQQHAGPGDTASQPSDSDHDQPTTLTFPFRSKSVPVYVSSHISVDLAQRALDSETFQQWVQRCESSRCGETTTTTQTDGGGSSGTKCLDLHSVELQSIDLFGPRRVGFIKLKSHATLTTTTGTNDATNGDENAAGHATTSTPHPLPGICFLRGNAVSILVVLQCLETNERYILMVEQPRIPVGLVSSLELPAGMIDSASDGIKGTAIRELEEECGIQIFASELTDLTQYLMATPTSSPSTTSSFLANMTDGLAPSPGGCDEHIRLLYLHRFVTQDELTTMQGRLTGLREEGELITLHVIPYEEAWKISGDMKVMCSLFLLERLQKEGKIPVPIKPKQLPLTIEPQRQLGEEERVYVMNNGLTIPIMAFGLYLVPADEQGEEIITRAIEAGYRHFDTASYYGNEATLGRAIAKSGIPRTAFFLCTKVWNDAQKGGRQAVRESVLTSLKALGDACGDANPYWDLLLVHWPVPGHYVETYKELEALHSEGKLKSIGISNFSVAEYEALVQSGITVPPAVHQMEVSPVMYRGDTIDYFEQANVLVIASKALSRGTAWDMPLIQQLATKYSVSPAQIMLRWSIQKGLIVVAKTAHPERMRENRNLWNFSLYQNEMDLLDALTTKEAVDQREALEEDRKRSM